MKRLAIVFSLVLMTGLMFQSCKKSDESIRKDVNKALTERNYDMITSTVKDGMVTISGTVESLQQRSEVENIVRSVKDVKSVTSNVIIKESEPEILISPDQTIQSAIDAGLTAAGYTGVKVEVKDGEVILTGELKRSELTKVMQIANEANPKSVKNELNLK